MTNKKAIVILMIIVLIIIVLVFIFKPSVLGSNTTKRFVSGSQNIGIAGKSKEKPVYYCPSKAGTPYYSYDIGCKSRDISIS